VVIYIVDIVGWDVVDVVEIVVVGLKDCESL